MTMNIVDKGGKLISTDDLSSKPSDRHFRNAWTLSDKIITEDLATAKKELTALEKDKSTRQAVINIWRENPRSSLDVPCTLSLQFFLREASDELWLHTTATMRSNDVWLGTPYDTFNFSAISFYLCLLLNQRETKCKLGKLTIQAGSRHLYETDAHKLDDVLISTHNENRIFSMNDLIHRYKNRPNSFIKSLKRAANFSFKKAEYKMRILHSG